MTVVCDTGPSLHLLEANALDLLPAIGTVWTPPAVSLELSQITPNGFAHKPAWLQMRELDSTFADRAEHWRAAGLLHAGEAAALGLALQLRPDWFLADDATARVLAESLGVETHGSLGVVLWTAGQGRLSRQTASEKLKALFRSSLWVSARVQQEARRALDRIFG